MPPNTSIDTETTASLIEDSFNRIVERTPYFDYEISSSDLFNGAFQIVSYVFPTWKRQDIEFVQCKDGITNQLVKVTHRPTDFSVLVRAYGKGSELIIDRNQEVINIITLCSQSMCPPLYARFKNGLVYGFIKGRVSTVEELAQNKSAKWIATKLAKWHKVTLPKTKEAHFIDYEYGCYAYRGFDIGNHFNEFAGFDCEYWRYPTKEFQLKWFDWYLTESIGVKPTDEEKEKMYIEVNAFSLVSHFYWGLWAMIQAMVSDIDFNYMEYAVLRFNEYYKRRDQVFSTF
ncbi:hypothetical protein RMATCC62417_01757 [Rhizopus microsporus]|nr:hypothetical protein RMATCC62417_01757 [Rhizopus microsporus]